VVPGKSVVEVSDEKVFVVRVQGHKGSPHDDELHLWTKYGIITFPQYTVFMITISSIGKD